MGDNYVAWKSLFNAWCLNLENDKKWFFFVLYHIPFWKFSENNLILRYKNDYLLKAMQPYLLANAQINIEGFLISLF